MIDSVINIIKLFLTAELDLKKKSVMHGVLNIKQSFTLSHKMIWLHNGPSGGEKLQCILIVLHYFKYYKTEI